MSVEEARAFIRENHRAILATRRRDGGVSMVPVLAVVDATRSGAPVDQAGERAARDRGWRP